jgi:hypothetical protein
MADNRRGTSRGPEQQRRDNSDTERENVRSSNDRDRELEREGIESEHDRNDDNAVRGHTQDTDPDSAEAEIDRDDTVDE